MNTGFQFKQFFVKHDRCAMKVGTDGVLIGCWCPTRSTTRILDIGTGSGLIALMLAQRCPEAQIDAIDIDKDAAEQARENFAASPWAARLSVAQCALQEWQGRDYDLIVSNPPYFVKSLKNPNAARSTARHNDTLPFGELIRESVKRLTREGILTVIVPTEAEEELQQLATEQGLQCTNRCYIHPKPNRQAKRVMIAWQLYQSAELTEHTETLILEDELGSRSHDYQQLTRDFYL